jgi:hypothetical protein
MSFKWKNREFKLMDEIIEAGLSLKGEEQQAFVKAYCETGMHARGNVGYFSGYYDNAKRAEICKVFGTSHPIFGTDPVTPDEAFELGKKFGEASKGAGK